MAEKAARITKTLKLKKSGRTVTYPETYTTRELLDAQKAAGKETRLAPLYMAQRLCTFDGKTLTAGEIMDLPGADFAQLSQAIFNEGEEDEAGNV